MKKPIYKTASLVAAVAFIVYILALRNDFVQWDDNIYVTDNYFIRSINLSFFKWIVTSFYASNWHPLTWLSHALDYAVWGLNPLGHHLTSISLHAVNTFLVVVLAAGLFKAAGQAAEKNNATSLFSERGVLAGAACVGLLFGLHPLHVESVAWVSERKDVLCAFFFLLSIMMYTGRAWGMEQGAEGKKSRASTPCSMLHAAFADKHYLGALGFFILALLSKPMAVTLPVVLLLLDWYPFGRIRSFTTLRTMSIEKIPFIGLSIVSSILTVLAQNAGDAVVPRDFVPLSVRLIVGTASIAGYLEKMIVPSELLPFYAYPNDVSLFSFRYFLPIILVAAITVVCLSRLKKQKMWAAAWAWYGVTLLPVLGFVQVGGQSMADRYTYLPSLGPFFVIGTSVAWVVKKLDAIPKRTLPKAGVWVAGLGVLAALTAATAGQIRIWENSISLWSYVIEKEQGKAPLAYNQRGTAYSQQGLAAKAVEDYTRAIELNPAYYEAYNNRGMVLYKSGRFAEAIGDFDKAISLHASYAEAYNNRGMAFDDAGRPESAFRDYDRAIELNPSYAKAYNNRGTLYGKAGRFDQAIDSFERALAINHNFIEAYVNRAFTYGMTGRLELAVEDFGRAIRLNPNDAANYVNRAKLYLRMGRKDAAVDDLRRACGLGSKDACSALQ